MSSEVNQTQQHILRAMAMNYAEGDAWDCLDSEACAKAADEIAALEAECERLRVCRDMEIVSGDNWKKKCQEAEDECDQLRAAMFAQPTQPALTVWEGAMPESNGKSNFTAVLMRKGGRLFDGLSRGMTIARSEYPDRVRYEADCVRYLIGELQEEPCIIDYDADKHSGYSAPAQPAVQVEQPQAIADEEERARKDDAAFNLRQLFLRGAKALNLEPDETSWFEIVGELEKLATIAAQPCEHCELDGVWATDGAGPFDCYACGKKAGAAQSSPAMSSEVKRYSWHVGAGCMIEETDGSYVESEDYEREVRCAIAAAIRMQDKCAALEAECEKLREALSRARDVLQIMRQHEDQPNGYKYPVSLWFPTIDAALGQEVKP